MYSELKDIPSFQSWKVIKEINSLPPVYKHGDYHVGNLVLTPNGNVGVIDFNRWEYGDGYEEFYKIQSFDG